MKTTATIERLHLEPGSGEDTIKVYAHIDFLTGKDEALGLGAGCVVEIEVSDNTPIGALRDKIGEALGSRLRQIADHEPLAWSA